MCPLCGESKETVTHALILCPEIKWMWNISPLRLEVKEQGEFYFADWCTNRAKVVKAGEWWDIFWVLLWGVWLRRNAWVFERKVIKVEEVVSRAMKLVGEYQPQEEPKILTERVEPIQPSRWKPPGFGLYKINSDAAVFEDGKVGLGGVMRDDVGDVIAAVCEEVRGRMEVSEAEAMAARLALSIAIDVGLRDIILESDCLKLITQLKNGKEDQTSFGFITRDIQELAKSCRSISFEFVRREGNKVAHKMAHISCKFGELRVWMEEVPTEANSYVLSDLESLNE